MQPSAAKPSGSAFPAGWKARTCAGDVRTIEARTRPPVTANSSTSAGEAPFSAVATARTYRVVGWTASCQA